MYGGDVVESAPVKRVLRRGRRHPYSEALLAAMPRVDRSADALAPIPGQVPTLARPAGGLPLPVALPAADRQVRRAAAADPARRRAGARRALLGARAVTGSPMSAPLLEVRGLTKTFKERRGWPIPTTVAVRALDGVSFDVARGEALGIVGESGCGKSTVARAVPAPDRARRRQRRASTASTSRARERRRAARAAPAPADRLPGPGLGARSAPAHRRRARRADQGPRHRAAATT